jgi:hypothetical protein
MAPAAVSCRNTEPLLSNRCLPFRQYPGPSHIYFHLSLWAGPFSAVISVPLLLDLAALASDLSDHT